jgi:hypothetical protein
MVAEARDRVLDGVERAQRDADQPAVALGLEVLAAVATAGGATGFAATLLGTASAHRDSATVRADTAEAAAVEATAAALRTALGTTGFRHAYGRGRGLPPEAVLAGLPAAWPVPDDHGSRPAEER